MIYYTPGTGHYQGRARAPSMVRYPARFEICTDIPDFFKQEDPKNGTLKCATSGARRVNTIFGGTGRPENVANQSDILQSAIMDGRMVKPWLATHSPMVRY